jgi:DNA-binding transcriptional MerR regulator
MLTRDAQERFSFDELCALVDMPARTVRYYIQEGLVDRPEGSKRGAFYTRTHLDQLLTIRKWQRAGLSLERIKEILAGPQEGELPPERPRRSGDVAVWSHIHIRAGVELVIEPQAARLTPEQVRALAREVTSIIAKLEKEPPR